jgi:hypothetical protein
VKLMLRRYGKSGSIKSLSRAFTSNRVLILEDAFLVVIFDFIFVQQLGAACSLSTR